VKVSISDPDLAFADMLLHDQLVDPARIHHYRLCGVITGDKYKFKSRFDFMTIRMIDSTDHHPRLHP
jgi:hypothetical protein